MTHKRKLVHIDLISIRWGDLDSVGHVNNTIYFRYMEQARIDWFASLGFPVGSRDEGPVIVNASCTFIKQINYPGDVEVKTFAGKVGRSSVETWIEMRPSYDAATVYAEGGAKIVWVNYALGKSQELPAKIRQAAED
ncbi:MAG: thioesterase family protein [Betaproteobacteria bacterium]